MLAFPGTEFCHSGSVHEQPPQKTPEPRSPTSEQLSKPNLDSEVLSGMSPKVCPSSGTLVTRVVGLLCEPYWFGKDSQSLKTGARLASFMFVSVLALWMLLEAS